MEPIFTCPPGHRLDNKMCVIPPTMSCPTGHQLINGMCQQIAKFSSSPIPASPNPTADAMSMMMPTSPVVAYASPISPVTESNCPTGYQFSVADNMCYPLKI